jgi:transcriptional regulator with GAF, ATPase, and Fis domain
MTAKPVDQLVELTWFLAEERPIEVAVQRVADLALELLGAESTSVRLLDDEGRHVASARAGAAVDVAPASRERPSLGVSGFVADTAAAVRIDDVFLDPRFRGSEGDAGMRSQLAVPLLATTGVVGVLCAMHRRAGYFDKDHEGMLRLLANCASPLLERSRTRVAVLPQLDYAMGSPLRLRLVAELLEVGDMGLTLEDAIVRSGRYQQDVQACFAPMIRWRIVEHDGHRYRLRHDLSQQVLDALRRHVTSNSEQLSRERHVRHYLLGGMIGLDAKMQMVFELVRQVARIDVPVLITGETGTGKELVARAIHDISPRRQSFFGAVNCATLKETLFESQVFGHMRGAFTGAVQDYMGLVERCDGGTLFLDEVGDLSLENQVKLLRFLQEGTFARLGDTRERRSNFRLISATNRDLGAMVAAGTFRDDLYYRLAVFPIRLPSLRERLGDLKYLVEGMLAVHAQRFSRNGEPPTIVPEALKKLERYHWPGNVRELENVLMRAMVMAGGGPIGPEHLSEVDLLSDAPPDSSHPPSPDDSGELYALRTLDDVQRDHIMGVLRAQRGNIKATAQILGISRTTLYKKIRDYRIDAPI